ncbi:hypothetical protein CRG98_005327 [Punica granatum]|uniref:Uncharacterized protein n=1 Tax=Punica granatum TaxID=22663 RepID=A0A2I0L114_PUNGR|nr:hypothetical protein CRG98_005327 [Punica granatum]
MEWWGSGPIRLRFPMMGQGFGPGGKLSCRPRQKRRERRMRARVASHAAVYEAQWEEMSIVERSRKRADIFSWLLAEAVVENMMSSSSTAYLSDWRPYSM